MTGKTRRNNSAISKPFRLTTPTRRPGSRALARIAAPAREHPWLSIATATAGLLIAGSTMLLGQPDHTQAAVDPRTRVFANYSACLLTGPGGTGDQPAAAIWKGMQQASSTTNERVTNQPIIGAQTVQNAEEYINTLSSLRCRVVITIGQNPAQAAFARATAYPGIKFITIAASIPSQRPENISGLPVTTGETITGEITQSLITDFNTRSTTTSANLN